MIDTHCHLNDNQYNGIVDEIVNNFLDAGIEKVVCVGYNAEANDKAKEIAKKYDCVYYAVGVHPDDAKTYDKIKLENQIKNKDEKLVAIGEIGLDYFHNKDNKNEQMKVFEDQICLAEKYNLPIIIHCRDAYGDTLEVLKRHFPLKIGVVFHCYSGSLEYAKELVKNGVKISFTGSVTFKNAKNLQEVAKNLPNGSFFFETDSPYLTPEPNRGKVNEPKNVFDVAKFVANLRETDSNKLIIETDKTAKEFFKI